MSTSSTVGSVQGSPTPSQVDRTDKGGMLGQDAFMQLLVAQMQHQDPLAPTDSSQMMAQLAQFTSVEQLNNLTTGLKSLQTGQDFQASVALIGKTVSYKDAHGNAQSGVVSAAKNASGGAVVVLDDGTTINYSDVTQVQ